MSSPLDNCSEVLIESNHYESSYPYSYKACGLHTLSTRIIRMTETLTLSVPTNPKYLCIIRKMTDGISSCMGFSDLEVGRIVLAMDEACSNIIRHSCGNDPTKKIDISFSVFADQIEIKIKDNGCCGKGFDTGPVKEKDTKNPTPGGFGVNIIKTVMDRVEYTRNETEGNTLTLIKRLCKTGQT